MLLILALLDASLAGTRDNLVSKSRASDVARSGTQRKTGNPAAKKCSACEARAARAKTRSAARNAKQAKNVPCHPKGYVDPKIEPKYNAALREMKRAGIKPQVTSAWRSSDRQEELYRCSMSARCRRANPGLYRALPPGESLHEAGFAVDMSGIASGPRGSKRLTPKGKRIVGIMRKNGFKWRYGLADPAHFEADPRKHGYRSVKQAIKKTNSTCQVNLARNKAHPAKSGNKVGTNRTEPSSRTRASAETARLHRHTGKVRA
jgi:hypothetical protein